MVEAQDNMHDAWEQCQAGQQNISIQLIRNIQDAIFGIDSQVPMTMPKILLPRRAPHPSAFILRDE